LKEALSLIASELLISRHDITELTGDGDVVWAMSDVEVIERHGTKQARIKLVNRWQFRDGKIASCTEFFDSAGTLLQLDRITTRAA
jgi:ketosteroid isomerase-like protein